MTEEIAIRLRNISKVYKRYHRPADRLKEILLPGKSRAEQFWALRDINLYVPKGETVGIIGRNGSGKSTLLQIITGTLQPTAGQVEVDGRISALLELGSGFNPEFTGRQNVFFNGRILGLSQQEIEERFEDIAAFADIGEFIEQPVKTYSSGMLVRLAFAVAVHVEPEVFVVDEALAVGDIVFQHKCLRRIKALMDSGVTTLFVSHDASAVKSLCNYAFMLNEGQVVSKGKPVDVFIEYMKLVTQIELAESEYEVAEESSTSTEDTLLNSEHSESANVSRRGSGQAKIESVQLIHENGALAIPSPVFKSNEKVTLKSSIKVKKSLESFIFGFYVCDKNGNEIIGSNTEEEEVPIGAVNAGDTVEVSFTFNLPLRPGGYSLTVAGAESYTTTTCDWIDNAFVFKVLPPNNGKIVTALIDLPMKVDLAVQGDQVSNSVLI